MRYWQLLKRMADEKSTVYVILQHADSEDGLITLEGVVFEPGPVRSDEDLFAITCKDEDDNKKEFTHYFRGTDVAFVTEEVKRKETLRIVRMTEEN